MIRLTKLLVRQVDKDVWTVSSKYIETNEIVEMSLATYFNVDKVIMHSLNFET